MDSITSQMWITQNLLIDCYIINHFSFELLRYAYTKMHWEASDTAAIRLERKNGNKLNEITYLALSIFGHIHSGEA